MVLLVPGLVQAVVWVVVEDLGIDEHLGDQKEIVRVFTVLIFLLLTSSAPQSLYHTYHKVPGFLVYRPEAAGICEC